MNDKIKQLPTQSNELSEFYKEYLEWVDAGVPEHQYFVTFTGLCSNFGYFAQYHGARDYTAFSEEMIKQFVDAGLNERYPFNRDYSGYNIEVYSDSIHLNPKRIAFVRERANGNV